MTSPPPLGRQHGLLQADVDSTDWREAAVGLTLLGVDVYPGWGIDQRGYCRCTIGRCRGDVALVEEIMLRADRQGRAPPLCAPGKHPIGSHKAASRDWDVVQHWCLDPNSQKGSPTNNLLIATGRPGGLIAIDLDGPVAEDSWRRVREELGLDEQTVVVRSGRLDGGRHLYYRLADAGPIPTNRASSVLGPGIDVRGAGGYVVAPPSMHASGRRYHYAPGRSPSEIDIAPVPDALLARLIAGGGEARPRASGPRPPRTRQERAEHARTLRPGDGDAHGGFDQPALRWSLRYWREMGVNADPAPLIAGLRAAFERAPVEQKRRFDLVRYCSESYLSGRAEQARQMVIEGRKQ